MADGISRGCGGSRLRSEVTVLESDRMGPPSIGAEGERIGRADMADVTEEYMPAWGAMAEGEWPASAVLDDADCRVAADPVVAVMGDSVVISISSSVGIVNLGSVGSP